MDKTKHAIIRSRQRGIKEASLEMIMSFGTKVWKPGGIYEYFMSNKDIYRAEQFFKRSIQSIDKVRGKGIIVDNRGTIITAYQKRK